MKGGSRPPRKVIEDYHLGLAVVQSQHVQTDMSGCCFSCAHCCSVLQKLLHCCCPQQHSDTNSAEVNLLSKSSNQVNVPAVIQGHLFLPAFSSLLLSSNQKQRATFRSHPTCVASLKSEEFTVVPNFYVQCCTIPKNTEITAPPSPDTEHMFCDDQAGKLVDSSTNHCWEPLGVCEKRTVFVDVSLYFIPYDVQVLSLNHFYHCSSCPRKEIGLLYFVF
ncbi:unnamed protein product [Soboliphyme baturini]|uniref:Phospholipid scramblase n=1 Tax=Soboliphyme baturini TaxID=241478 RepID=A0A183IN60_9BILA|nr:unnamed protein product [Soboliphyme baturini]